MNGEFQLTKLLNMTWTGYGIILPSPTRLDAPLLGSCLPLTPMRRCLPYMLYVDHIAGTLSAPSFAESGRIYLCIMIISSAWHVDVHALTNAVDPAIDALSCESVVSRPVPEISSQRSSEVLITLLAPPHRYYRASSSLSRRSEQHM